MSRKNIFQLVEENYDVQFEIRKINDLFTEKVYFKKDYSYYNFKKLITEYCFSDWKYCGTCITIDEYISRADASISKILENKESAIINNLEVMENFIKLYWDNSNDLYEKHNIKYYNEFSSVFCKLINTLEKRMGLTKREYKDKVIIYPKNAPLERVVDLCEDEDIQWELIRYVREDLSLAEKRKSLAYLATNLYIEVDLKEQDEHIKSLLNESCNVLNNLHIRHNNKTGKWENKALENISEQDANLLCDMVYNEMLTIVLLREHKEYEKTYAEFRRKQKDAAAKKKISEDENNG